MYYIILTQEPEERQTQQEKYLLREKLILLTDFSD